MSNQDGHRAGQGRAPTLNGSRPKDAVDWILLRALNERCLDSMVRVARSDQERAPPAVSSNRALWCDLDTAARQRAAHHRLLLLDINFSDAAWWAEAAESRPVERESNGEGYLQPNVASELMREALTLAWVIARANPGQASIFCGMSPLVVGLFRSFTPSDLERVCARHQRHVRLRFDDQPSYWRMHLTISARQAISERSHLQAPSEDRQQRLV